MNELLSVLYCFLQRWSPYMGFPALLVSSAALGLTVYNEWRRLKRKEAAERATLPLVLSEINQYAEEAKEWVTPLFEKLENDTLNKQEVDFESSKPPKLPEGLSGQLKAIIEATNSQSARQRLADMVTTLQLVTARLKGLEQGVHRKSSMIFRANLQEQILDIASLHAISSSMFKYSRRQTKVLEKYDYDALRSALTQLYFFDDTNEHIGLDGSNVRDMFETLKKRERDLISPYIFHDKVGVWSLPPETLIAWILKRTGLKK